MIEKAMKKERKRGESDGGRKRKTVQLCLVADGRSDVAQLKWLRRGAPYMMVVATETDSRRSGRAQLCTREQRKGGNDARNFQHPPRRVHDDRVTGSA